MGPFLENKEGATWLILGSAAADLSANLKNRVTKATAVKVLGSLQEKGEITGKTYGKTIVYCALQVSHGRVAEGARGRGGRC